MFSPKGTFFLPISLCSGDPVNVDLYNSNLFEDKPDTQLHINDAMLVNISRNTSSYVEV